MLMRALIVLLLVLNLGVAAWWWSRVPPGEVGASADIPVGVAVLDLVKNAPAPAAPMARVAAPHLPGTCVRLGPFGERSVAEQASARLGSAVLRAQVSAMPASGASSYRVLLPPAPSRDAAQATAERIAAAGFSDLLVLNQGDDANSIALGQYRSRESALRRQSELAAAGFPAEVRAVGRGAATQWWLEVAAAAGANVADLQRQSGAAQSLPQDCAAVR